MSRIFIRIGLTFLTLLTVFSTIRIIFLLHISIIVLLLSGVTCSVRKLRRNKTLIIVLATSLLAAVSSYLNYSINIKYLEKFDDTDIKISGKLIDLPYKKQTTTNYLLKVEEVNDKKIRPFNIKLTCSEPLEIDIYDKFTGKIHAYSPKNIPEFNLKAYYRSKNIHILGHIYNYLGYDVEKTVKHDWYYYILKPRYKLLTIPMYLFNSDISGIINAIFLGEKHNIPEETKRNFQDIGVYHLIAVSGVHLSIITQFLFYILKKSKIKIKISYILTTLATILFMAVSGFSVSVMRAGIMTIILFLGAMIFRIPDSLNSLGLAIFLITLFNPNSALDIGLWMSTFATLGIILFESNIREYIETKLNINQNKIIKHIILTISTSLSVSLLTIPIEILFFRKISVIFILSNLLILPIVTLILNFVLILDLFYLILPIYVLSPIIVSCGLLTRALLYTTKILSKIPFSVISLDYKFVKLCVIFSIILIAFQYFINRKHEYIKITLILCVLIFATGFLSYRIFSHNNIEILVQKYLNSTNLFISKNSNHVGIIYAHKKDINYKLEFSKYTFLYLDTPNCEEIADKHSNNLVIVPINFDDNYEIDTKKLVRFDENISVSFFKNTLTDFLKIDKYKFSLININGTKILICFNGGDASKLPENFKNCDVLMLGALPINHENITANTVIISTNKTDSDIILSKLNKNLNLISLSDVGNIYLNIGSTGAYKIGRTH